MAGTVLIVDDVATNRIVLKVKLGAASYETIPAPDGETALRLARARLPDLVLLDVQLPDLDGIEVCRILKADPVTAAIPVVMLTAYDDFEARLASLAAGADDFLPKPLSEPLLLARLRSLMRARDTEEELRLRGGTTYDLGVELGFAEPALPFLGAAGQLAAAPVPNAFAGDASPVLGHGAANLPGAVSQGTVALVAARRETAMHWRHLLAPLLLHRITLEDGHGALGASGDATGPDVYLIAADLDDAGDGLRLMSELRSRHATRHAGVCILLPRPSDDAAAVALDLGASDILTDPFDPREMALRIDLMMHRKRQSDRLRASIREGLRDGLRLAVTDPLTGLPNRRYALPHLGRIAEAAGRTGRRYAVMVLDLDRFKSVNDVFGHPAGDAVLVEVARRLADQLRAADMVARIGGEEFLVAMPDTTLGAARIAAERLCRVVEAQPIVLPDGRSIRVTLSIGLAIGAPPDAHRGGDTVTAVIDRADRALLAAKAEGRNQVTVSRTAA